MEFNQEEFLTKLYSDSMAHTAAINLLKSMFIGYVSTQNQAQGDALEKFFKEQFDQFVQNEILSSPMKDEYINYISEDGLKKLRNELGF
jgi:hypothetical protein